MNLYPNFVNLVRTNIKAKIKKQLIYKLNHLNIKLSLVINLIIKDTKLTKLYNKMKKNPTTILINYKVVNL